MTVVRAASETTICRSRVQRPNLYTAAAKSKWIPYSCNHMLFCYLYYSWVTVLF